MRAIYCDRCQELTRESNSKTIKIDLGYSNEDTRELEVCGNCHSEIEASLYLDLEEKEDSKT